MKPRILDLFCGAGGAAEGYHRAGFEVVGVDIKPQQHYPFEFEFHQADALSVLGWNAGHYIRRFDAIHASPPCQAFTKAQKLQGNEHPDLIAPIRELLKQTELPYVIENVPGAPLHYPIELRGEMFGVLRTSRPRLFETNWPLFPPETREPTRPHAKMGRPPKSYEWMHVVGHFSGANQGRRAMGIHWMSKKELAEAIPPAYTEYVGWELREYLRQKAAA